MTKSFEELVLEHLRRGTLSESARQALEAVLAEWRQQPAPAGDECQARHGSGIASAATDARTPERERLVTDAELSVPKDHPMMQEWERYQQTDAYENTFRWAAREQHRDGSLWAAFEAGFRAGCLRFHDVQKHAAQAAPIHDEQEAALAHAEEDAATDSRTLHWFVQRAHPTKRGYIQVAGFPTKAEADAQVETWKAEAPKLRPYVWERHTQATDARTATTGDDMSQDNRVVCSECEREMVLTTEVVQRRVPVNRPDAAMMATILGFLQQYRYTEHQAGHIVSVVRGQTETKE